MNRFVYRPDSSQAFEVGGVRGFAVTAKAGRISGDVALLSVNGSHGGVKDLSSERFYVVSEGTGAFEIEGKNYPVSVDDVIIIPPNTPYDFSGEMKLVMFCSPPFDPANDVPLEKMQTPTVKVRAATQEDAAIIADLGASTYRETYADHIRAEDIEPRIKYKYGKPIQIAELNEVGSRHFLAVANGQVCGFARLQSVGPLQGGMPYPVKIDRLYILKAFQGIGIGKLLMNSCLEFALEKKATHLWLGALETNDFAMSFYTKFGFKHFGEEPFVIGKNTYKYLLLVKPFD